MQQTKLILIIVLFALCACKKDSTTQETIEEENNPPPVTISLKKISCNLNGTLFETDSVASNPYYIDTIANFKILSCGGIKNTTYIGFAIGFPGISMALPFTILGYPNASVHLHRIVNNVYYDTYVDISTTLQITSNDTVNHKVSGVFSGIVVENTIHDTVHITNGKFTNLSYFLVY
jgi:hypothetical protein